MLLSYINIHLNWRNFMRLTTKHVEDFVGELSGKDVVPLVKLLKGKKNVNEFKIAEKLSLSVNQVRNMFYRMSEHSLVSSTRKKDKKKGWYVYYWTFNLTRAKQLVLNFKKRKLEELKKRLSREGKETFFVCPSEKIRLRFENALEHNFKCPECGAVLEEEDNIKYLEELKVDIQDLEKELGAKEAQEAT